MARLLVVAWGNPLAGDDSVAWRIADEMERLRISPDTTILTALQLTPDMAQPVSEADSVVFVDASATGPAGAIALTPLDAPGNSTPFSTHHLTPAALLALAAALYGKTPKRAAAVSVGGQSFTWSESLSEPVGRAVPDAALQIRDWLERV